MNIFEIGIALMYESINFDMKIFISDCGFFVRWEDRNKFLVTYLTCRQIDMVFSFSFCSNNYYMFSKAIIFTNPYRSKHLMKIIKQVKTSISIV